MINERYGTHDCDLVDKINVSTPNICRSHTTIARAVRELKRRNGLAGKHTPVIHDGGGDYLPSTPYGLFFYVLFYGNGPGGDYAVSLHNRPDGD